MSDTIILDWLRKQALRIYGKIDKLNEWDYKLLDKIRKYHKGDPSDIHYGVDVRLLDINPQDVPAILDEGFCSLARLKQMGFIEVRKVEDTYFANLCKLITNDNPY